MQELRRFFKANPQVLVLLIICVVLGLGTFLAVVFGVVTSKNPTTPSGEPSGSVTPHVALVARAYTRETRWSTRETRWSTRETRWSTRETGWSER